MGLEVGSSWKRWPKERVPEIGIPKCSISFKEIVANKMRFMEYEIVTLTKECSSRIQKRLPTDES
ncbi:hypothetical protein KY285_035925 [Solanum tuberosum]|nr:hypothetical protein KY289_036091 [Solanum tuberosum]KAH0639339.1 hypothetical protein KY285_035925 [Solanum tuberosum]